MAVTVNGETLPDRGTLPQESVGEGARRAAFLRFVAKRPSSRPGGPPYREMRLRHPRRLARGERPRQGKVLLFKNLLDAAGKEPGAARLHQATFYLASALKAAGVPVVLSDLKLARLREKGPAGLDGLSRLLRDHPGVTLAGLTLYDSCFEDQRRLARFLRAKTRAFVAVGGIMPTLNPREVFVHLPEAHLVARGAGEDVLPAVARILAGRDAASGLEPGQRQALADLEGILFGDRECLIWAAAERVGRVSDLDRSVLDFSLLERENVSSGLCLCLSRGCRYGCAFCASMDKGRFTGKSPEAVAACLAAYGRRLRELYGRWSRVPPAAFGVGFYDDDFLSDPSRARAILTVLGKSPFFVLFIQAAVNSFFRVRNARPSDELDRGLLEALEPGLFLPKVGGEEAAPAERPWVYIGTESFCDVELQRLGKGYGYERVERVALALSRRGVRQAHHLIVANAETRLEDLLESLGRIARLESLCGAPFGVLKPPSPHLVSFYPTASFRRLERLGLRGQALVRGTLRLRGFPEFDYPLVEKDVPLDPDVREFAERAQKGLSADGVSELEGLLLKALMRSEELDLSGKDPARAARLRRAVDRFHPSPVTASSAPPAAGLQNPKSNIQLFVTRRCQLRCTYCPVAKRDADMALPTALQAADFLLGHRNGDLRMDFGGGEPLLNFPVVREAAEYAEARARERGKRLSFYMVTNAIELDGAKLEWMARRRFVLELSLDGNRRDHNLQKPPAKEGLDPYAATRRGVELALRSGVECLVVAVADPARVGRLSENFEHLLDIGARSFDLSYAVGSFWGDDDAAVFFSQVGRIARRHLRQLRRGEIRLGNLGGRVEPTVLNSELMVDTDGSLHLLSEWMFETAKPCAQPPFRLGRVQERPDINAIRWSRFHCYYTLARMYGRDARVRRVILNNMAFGTKVGRFFEALSERIHGRR
ncbi:MAG: radical SAM protein [Elusimicrobia bacterium]|nr:radical SAM protein [Elusimicrobiota bacterium]